MANAGCINAIGFDGCFLQTLQQLDSACIGVGVQFTAPNPLDDKRFDYIKYTDKCGNTCCLTGENEIMIYATQGVIKNLTLTNDDANEVVNVKRTDVFGSNWKKTVVRYKTGGYPTSITDGTLAVEELVQNQYQSSGYNVSGLTDGTTYYFSAFAVAQDDTIIVVQSSSITTDFGRKPSADTQLYLPLTVADGIADKSGKGRSTSIVGTAGIETFGGVQCLHCNGGRISIGAFSYTSNTTIVAWCYTTGIYQSDGKILAFEGNNGGNGFGLIYDSNWLGTGYETMTYSGTTALKTGGNGAKLNQRVCICAMIENGTPKFYMKGNGVNESNTGTNTASINTVQTVDIGGLSRISRRRYGYISQAIVETKARSYSDFEKYYNKTKSNYGIS